MHPELIEIMRNQVCSIYRAVTGTDMPAVEVADCERRSSRVGTQGCSRATVRGDSRGPLADADRWRGS